MGRKSHKLIVENDYRFLLTGISCHENDYRISWAINTRLGISFKRLENLCIFNPRINQVQEFPLYHYTDPETLLHYWLISNRCDNGFLIEEMSNIDYLIKISGDTGKNFLQQLISKLKKIDIITTAFEINPESLKSRKRLLF